jgi:predicted transcriptional regulator
MSPRFSSGGLSTFDLLGDLSPSERTLTRLFLRNAEMGEKAISEAISELPEEKQMDKDEMKAALKSLTDKGWLEEKRSGFKKVYAIKQQRHR